MVVVEEHLTLLGKITKEDRKTFEEQFGIINKIP